MGCFQIRCETTTTNDFDRAPGPTAGRRSPRGNAAAKVAHAVGD
ncbi:hypothetical protein L841_1975 [Mycobacterium sp. MAC_080597_8934]|nr:hypothetical protein L841_1975 [Mycobacterium sp. MAC_080597_8934]